MTTHKILIPLDGSEFSRQILPPVRRLFGPESSQLILLHVTPLLEELAVAPARPPLIDAGVLSTWPGTGAIQHPSHSISATQVWHSVPPAVADALQGDAQALRAAGYPVSLAVRFGDPAQEILDLVEDEAVDLVAMATHSRTGLGRLVLGSVAEQVLHNITVPVMLMRPFARPARQSGAGELLAERLAEGLPVRMVVATDGSALAQLATTFAGELARRLSAELTLLVAVHGDATSVRSHKILDAARNLLGGLNSVQKAIPLAEFNYEVVLAQLAELPVDLLVIGPFEDRSPSSAYSVGLTARRLVQLAPTSVLVVKGEPRAAGSILACTAVGDEVVVDVAARLAKAIGAELRLLHVVALTEDECLALSDGIDIPLTAVFDRHTTQARYLKACIARLEALGFGHEAVTVRCGALPEAIFEEVREGGFDLIVVGSQTRPEYFLGSLADRVVRYAPRSVLVVRTS
ncbi:MAG TPA: hypothetical protein DEP84_16750 [Chloroflexi bacterium]|nr:hypothetical protein [Chloroflexota bacterium]